MKNTAREIANEVFDKAGWKVPSDYVCAVVVIAKDGSYGLATAQGRSGGVMKRKFENGALIEHYLGRGLGYGRDTETAFMCSLYGCRVLVSKERLEQKWPTEKDGPEGAAFRKFAARLADAVQRALAEGKTIGTPIEGDCCPLGCLEEAGGSAFPRAKQARTGEGEAWFAFYRAFDFPDDDLPNSPYTRLGRAYRARFVRP